MSSSISRFDLQKNLKSLATIKVTHRRKVCVMIQRVSSRRFRVEICSKRIKSLATIKVTQGVKVCVMIQRVSSRRFRFDSAVNFYSLEHP